MSFTFTNVIMEHQKGLHFFYMETELSALERQYLIKYGLYNKNNSEPQLETHTQRKGLGK